MNKADTDPNVRRELLARWRTLTPRERFQRALEHIACSRRCMMAGLRARFPHATDAELRQRLMQQLYPEFMSIGSK